MMNKRHKKQNEIYEFDVLGQTPVWTEGAMQKPKINYFTKCDPVDIKLEFYIHIVTYF